MRYFLVTMCVICAMVIINHNASAGSFTDGDAMIAAMDAASPNPGNTFSIAGGYGLVDPEVETNYVSDVKVTPNKNTLASDDVTPVMSNDNDASHAVALAVGMGVSDRVSLRVKGAKALTSKGYAGSVGFTVGF